MVLVYCWYHSVGALSWSLFVVGTIVFFNWSLFVVGTIVFFLVGPCLLLVP